MSLNLVDRFSDKTPRQRIFFASSWPAASERSRAATPVCPPSREVIASPPPWNGTYDTFVGSTPIALANTAALMWSKLPGAEPPANDAALGSFLRASVRSARVLYLESALTKNPPISAPTCASGMTSLNVWAVRFIAMVSVREFEAATRRLGSPFRLVMTFAMATAPLPPGMLVTYIVSLVMPVFCSTPAVVRQIASQPPPGFEGAMHSICPLGSQAAATG